MGMVEGIIRAAKATGADAIVRGSGELGGLVAGAILDLPVASAAPAAAKFYEPMIRPGVARAAAEHGLDGERVTDVDFDVLRIDRTPPSLEMPDYVAPPNQINVRPEAYDGAGDLPAWFDDLGGRPLVYVTLGTVMNGNIPLFRLIADQAQEPLLGLDQVAERDVLDVRISRVLATRFHGKWPPCFAGIGHPVSRVMATPSDRSSAAPA